MKRAVVFLFAGAVALAVAGCAAWHPASSVSQRSALPLQQPVMHFKLDGRLSVKAEENNFSGGLLWDRKADAETLLLSTPLGQGVAEIRRSASGVVLTDADGNTHVAESGEALLKRVVGIRLPVEGLVYWLSALPRPESAFRAEQEPSGRVVVLEQDGWRIEYGRYRQVEGCWLPAKVFARREDGLEFRLVVDTWQTQ